MPSLALHRAGVKALRNTTASWIQQHVATRAKVLPAASRWPKPRESSSSCHSIGPLCDRQRFNDAFCLDGSRAKVLQDSEDIKSISVDTHIPPSSSSSSSSELLDWRNVSLLSLLSALTNYPGPKYISHFRGLAILPLFVEEDLYGFHIRESCNFAII